MCVCCCPWLFASVRNCVRLCASLAFVRVCLLLLCVGVRLFVCVAVCACVVCGSHCLFMCVLLLRVVIGCCCLLLSYIVCSVLFEFVAVCSCVCVSVC